MIQATLPLTVVKIKSSSRCTPLPQANFLDDAAEAIQEKVNGVATMHWMDPLELHLRNDTNVKVCPVYKSSPVKYGDECFHYQILKNCVVKKVVSYTRKTVPDHRTICGLPWPKLMVSSTECKKGSIMLVLDSAAEVTLVRQPELLPAPRKEPLHLSSFMSDKSTCHLTGTIVGCTKDFDGKAVVCPIGFGGVIYEPGMKDNLASVPYMLRL